jgi:hypothetical protein
LITDSSSAATNSYPFRRKKNVDNSEGDPLIAIAGQTHLNNLDKNLEMCGFQDHLEYLNRNQHSYILKIGFYEGINRLEQ